MSSDNLMAALIGVLEGSQRGVGMVLQDALARRRSKEQGENEFDIYKQKLPMEEASRIKIANETRPPGERQLIYGEGGGLVDDITASPGGSVGVNQLSGPMMASGKGAGKEPGLESLIRGRDTELRKMLGEASPQKTTIPVMNKMIKLIDTEGVTGKGGQWKSILAPYAEAAGFSSEDLDTAQTYQLLSRLMAGPLRTEIVGPGQVSNYEQELLKELSGGGGTAKRAAKELLTYYKSTADRKVKDYNQMLSDSSALTPKFGQIYRPITIEKDNLEGLPVNKNSQPTILKQGKGWKLMKRGQ